MKTKLLCTLAVAAALGSAMPASAQSEPTPATQTQTGAFPLLDGKTTPLTLKIKDLDSSWRVFSAPSSSTEGILGMFGAGGNKVFTKGETVSVANEVFLVAYKADPPDMASLMAGGGMPKAKPLTLDTVIRLSLLNLHALNSMDGIHVFDAKGLMAENDATSSTDIINVRAAPIQSAQPAGEAVLLKNGSKAPDFEVRDDSGNPVKLSAYRGKVVVLDFWATWCGPCQESLPKTNQVAAKYAGKDVVFLGVNVWDKQTEFHKWLPDHKSFNAIKFAIDTHGQGEDVASKLYHVSGIPTQYVIDKKGRVVTSIVGYSDDEAELTQGIKTALSR